MGPRTNRHSPQCVGGGAATEEAVAGPPVGLLDLLDPAVPHEVVERLVEHLALGARQVAEAGRAARLPGSQLFNALQELCNMCDPDHILTPDAIKRGRAKKDAERMNPAMLEWARKSIREDAGTATDD